MITNEKIQQINFFWLCVVVFLLPLLFAPVLANYFDLPKTTILFLGALFSLGLWLTEGLFGKKVAFSKSPFLFPAGLFVLVSIISAVLTENKIPSLTSEPVVYAGCFLLLIVISQFAQKKESALFLSKTVLLSGAVLGLFAAIQNVITLVPYLSKLTNNNAFLNPVFSPTGSVLSQAIFLGILLPFAVGFYLHKRRWLPLTLLVAIIVGLLATTYGLFAQNPIILSHSTGWKVATGALGQSLSSAFFGSGPGNFIDAFTSFKGLDFNNSTFWNLRFTTSSNLYFYLLTTTGIAGLTMFAFLGLRTFKLAKVRLESGDAEFLEKGLLWSLLLGLVVFALLPAPIVALVVFFVFLGMVQTDVKNVSDETINKKLFTPVTLALTAIVFLFAGFYLGEFVLADYHFAKSINAARNNKATETYNAQIQAITLNPWNENYRISYSQTNLALADALAGQANLTDQQKQTVVTLVQQAIREARLAASLSPKRVAVWENLSLIYRSLNNFAQGADQWSLASQNRAIALDPANPRLRLDLGSLYFANKDYQNASQIFATAVNLKPDLANAHYNLAQALKLLNLNDQATQQLQLTASLVCASDQKSADCLKVNDEIKGLLPASVAKTNLATPSAQSTNLPKVKTTPPAKISTPSGELAQ